MGIKFGNWVFNGTFLYLAADNTRVCAVNIMMALADPLSAVEQVDRLVPEATLEDLGYLVRALYMIDALTDNTCNCKEDCDDSCK